MSVTKYLIAACSFSDTVQKQLMDRHPDGSASPGGELFKESFGVWVEPEDYRISKVLIAHFEIRWSYPPSSIFREFCSSLQGNTVKSQPSCFYQCIDSNPYCRLPQFVHFRSSAELCYWGSLIVQTHILLFSFSDFPGWQPEQWQSTGKTRGGVLQRLISVK